MTTSVVSMAARKPSSNGNGRLKLTTVTKRDGTSVNYDKHKIERAVLRCFTNSMGLPDTEGTKAMANAVAEQVDRLLILLPAPVTVEKIQDAVEQQLMACGHYDAAKEYIIYRETHRKLREEHPVDPAIVEAFKYGCSFFNGPNSHVQIFQAFDKFAKFDETLGRREVWPETVQRVMKFVKGHMQAEYNGSVCDDEWNKLEQGLLDLKASPSMRMVQMAGPALERCQSGVYNCSFQFLQGPTDLAEELYLLMQGCGVGFSVEAAHSVDHWPRVKKQRNKPVAKFVIPDNTIGWCDAYKTGLEAWMNGLDVEFDFSLIRPEGSPLKTKGGRASGPQPLKDLLNFARNRILLRQGSRLTSLDIHDINCYAHRIVQMGGVRRASGISVSDLDDLEMRNSKTGAFWDKYEYRNQANNSTAYDEKPTALEFMEEWMSLAKSGSGERGIFNRGGLKKQFPKRRVSKGILFGPNPCGEINLRHKGFCNLSIAIVRATDTWEEICEKVILATIWGTLQSTMTRFEYISAKWKENCEDERLLGVDILGHLDHPMLRPGAENLEVNLRDLRDLVIATNKTWADRLGIKQSAATTCGKPSGDSSVFFDAAPGFKGWHGEYFIRRVRANATNPVAQMLKDSGVPCHVDYDKSGLLVLEFPCKSPEGAVVLGEQTAIEQLEHWKKFKVNFTEHNPSVTIYVKPNEWLTVGNWVYENWDIVGGLAFLPFDGGVYSLAPYETITAEEYERRTASFPVIDWSKISRYEKTDQTDRHLQFACQGDRCTL